MSLALTTLGVFLVLCLSELGWRKGFMTNEVGRKFVHITVGTFVAFWPFFLSWNQIRLMSLAFLLVVVASRYLSIFTAIHSVQRPTYGEVFFALVVGLLTFITTNKSIYAAALLQMSVADGMAAIVGVEYGIKKHKGYRVFGHAKTVIGTLTFFIISVAILFAYGADDTLITWSAALLLAAIATAVENLAVAGLDNLLVPLFVAVALANL